MSKKILERLRPLFDCSPGSRKEMYRHSFSIWKIVAIRWRQDRIQRELEAGLKRKNEMLSNLRGIHEQLQDRREVCERLKEENIIINEQISVYNRKLKGLASSPNIISYSSALSFNSVSTSILVNL